MKESDPQCNLNRRRLVLDGWTAWRTVVPAHNGVYNNIISSNFDLVRPDCFRAAYFPLCRIMY